MKVKEKIIFNPHTNKIVGFEEGDYNTDVISIELASIIGNGTNIDESDNSRDKPSVAKQILISCSFDGEKQEI